MAESVMQSYRYCFVSESSCCMDVIPVLFASFTRLEVYGGRVSYPSYNRKWDTLSHHFTPLPSKVGPLSYNAQELSFRSSERNLQAILPTSQRRKEIRKVACTYSASGSRSPWAVAWRHYFVAPTKPFYLQSSSSSLHHSQSNQDASSFKRRVERYLRRQQSIN